ncbi:MAG: zinc-binding alcohol dehydrogenase family protein [Gammaproteobacteria bacterium PRO9]|nr:zinc-binding alcohol dehydrogenase family protein [Gammaproteobacteria bacterium PRO9]
MKAMCLQRRGGPLALVDLPMPRPGSRQVLIEVLACGVCRTDLHLVDGELPDIHYPIVPGHEIVGRVVECGAEVHDFGIGARVGVPWLGSTCGHCGYCRTARENLCDEARFTGYTLPGGYAEHVVAEADYCLPIPDQYSNVEAAPLLCAGLIGYRALAAAGDAQRIGLYGFGAAAHLIAQVCRAQGRQVFAFTRPGDVAAQEFAMGLGAVWAGGSDERPPAMLDAAILFAPVGALVPAALAATLKGGRVVCAGIYMSDIPSFPYHLLWGERTIQSVANLTRADGARFMQIATGLKLKVATQPFALDEANEALDRLRAGRIEGAAVLEPS